jgi:glycosyltransferase involved in cell wall biosynthesis
VINEAFVTAPTLEGRHASFTPPPLDARLFHPDGNDVRARYGVEDGVPLLLAIGKLAPRRGFEDILEAFAILRRRRPSARLMIIGHGPHQPALAALSGELGIGGGVIWAGYHEDDLAEHYRAADLLLFSARGSDEGHRAILEAMACGTPAATYPLEGVEALVQSGRSGIIASGMEADALADAAGRLLETRIPRQACAAESEPFAFPAAAVRLVTSYSRDAPRERSR